MHYCWNKNTHIDWFAHPDIIRTTWPLNLEKRTYTPHELKSFRIGPELKEAVDHETCISDWVWKESLRVRHYMRLWKWNFNPDSVTWNTVSSVLQTAPISHFEQLRAKTKVSRKRIHCNHITLYSDDKKLRAVPYRSQKSAELFQKPFSRL